MSINFNDIPVIPHWNDNSPEVRSVNDFYRILGGYASEFLAKKTAQAGGVRFVSSSYLLPTADTTYYTLVSTSYAIVSMFGFAIHRTGFGFEKMGVMRGIQNAAAPDQCWAIDFDPSRGWISVYNDSESPAYSGGNVFRTVDSDLNGVKVFNNFYASQTSTVYWFAIY